MPNSSWLAFLFGPGRTRDYWRQSHVHYRVIRVARGFYYFYRKSGIACFQLVSVKRGAGDRDRTGMASLEGWGSTIELHPRFV